MLLVLFYDTDLCTKIKMLIEIDMRLDNWESHILRSYGSNFLAIRTTCLFFRDNMRMRNESEMMPENGDKLSRWRISKPNFHF